MQRPFVEQHTAILAGFGALLDYTQCHRAADMNLALDQVNGLPAQRRSSSVTADSRMVEPAEPHHRLRAVFGT
jgi:hypothetical protein